MSVSERNDIEVGSASKGAMGAGRNVIAVIGVDRYHHWRSLSNAVRDATGAAALFRRLGFEEVTAPLLDERATGKAIQSLVTDDLMALSPDDSLVLFYAGHGGTRKHRLGDEEIKAGYLIPVDASSSPNKVSTWVDLEGWLRAVSLLPAKHILVILDACHSGIALDPIIKWRDVGSWQDVPLSALQARRSRRIITSALDDQVALDSGPVFGHSLFTGCLIEGLTHGIARGGSRLTTGSELGLYVQRRVQTYPHSRQTPDFGTFSFDGRGEMVIPLVIEPPEGPVATMGLPDGVDLVGLGDESELASGAEMRLSNANSGNGVGVSNIITSAEPVPTSSSAGLADKPEPACNAESQSEAELAVEANVVQADTPEPDSAEPVQMQNPSPLSSPVPIPDNAAPIALAPLLAEPDSAELVPTPDTTTPTPRTAISSLLSPPLPTQISEPIVSAPGARRWMLLGTVGAALAIPLALIGYLVIGRGPSWGDDPVNTPPGVAASHPPDARPVDAASGVAVPGSLDAESQPAGATSGHCPPGMVPVPAGTFRMGSPEGVGDPDEHPQHEVMLSAYCIDRTEVTVKAYAACVAAKGCPAAPHTVYGTGASAASVKLDSRLCNRDDRPDHPINCIDWNQAATYCTWAGKRLPTEAEWEYAARGTDGRVYPWGNETPDAKRLNACENECVATLKRELDDIWEAKMYDASDGWGATAPIGSFPEGVSPFGALDMAGNVWEWTADWYRTYLGAAATDPRGAKTGSARVLRGGAWRARYADGVRAAGRIRYAPTYRNNEVGFRCVRED